MSKFSRFGTAGVAEVLFQPTDIANLREFLQKLQIGTPVTVIGVGSNTLIREGGIPGIVIKLAHQGFGKCEILDEKRVRIGARALCREIAKTTLDAGIGGFEFLYCIPGSLGGVLRMNAGTRLSEIADLVVEIQAINFRGEQITIDRKQVHYGYRESNIPRDLVFTSAILEGTKRDQAKILEQMHREKKNREKAQPLRARTCGSTFKNPIGHSAWKLIEQAGMREYRVGGAMLSTKHCNFIINDNRASSYDIEYLAEIVRHQVWLKTGMVLEWEIERIGLFLPGREVPQFTGHYNKNLKPDVSCNPNLLN